MWKIALAFAIFAGLALLILSQGGDIDLGGEKHGSEAVQAPEPAKAPVATPNAASVPPSPAAK